MNRFSQDIRFGARMLLARPGFTLVAMATLALGIGATVAIFNIVNAVLLRPLPYPDAERIYFIGQQYSSGLSAAGEPKYLFWREQAQSFEVMGCSSGVGGAGGNLVGGSEAEYVDGLRVSADLFRVFGIQPALGRGFTAEEDARGGPDVAILSDSLWRKRFNADPAVIGKSVTLNDRSLTVIGVLPATARLFRGVDLFVPLRATPTRNYDPNSEVFGRLKPGVSPAQAAAELKSIAEKYRAAYPDQMQEGESVHIQPYRDLNTTDIKRYLWLLFGAVGFLLLIACANVANLQLVRSAGRQRELAIRQAMGANRWHLTRQLLIEGLMLSLAGAVGGMLLALWGGDTLMAFIPEGMLPDYAVIGFDWRVFAFVLALSLATGVIFGLVPVLQAHRINVNSMLKESAGRSVTGGRRTQNALVVVEIALSLLLLIGSGLLIRTFANLMNVSPGFDARNVLTGWVAVNGPRYEKAAQASAFYRDALERIRRLPGVESAAVTNILPLKYQFNMPVIFPDAADRVQSVQMRMITPEYFDVMKSSIRQGRAFTDGDAPGAEPVAIVNEAFVARLLKNKNPFQQQLSVGRGTNDPARRIVGIAADMKQYGLSDPASPTIFIPVAQMSDRLMATVRTFTGAYFVVRTRPHPLGLTEGLKQQIGLVDATLPVSQIQSLEQIVGASVALPRFLMVLIGLFAALGLLLAAVGIYGVISYSVAARVSEIGIRIALGARSGNVVWMVLRQGLHLAVLGVAIGLAGAFALRKLIEGMLFGVTATDVLTYAIITAVLIVIAMVACYLPARRASRVDPIIALRAE